MRRLLLLIFMLCSCQAHSMSSGKIERPSMERFDAAYSDYAQKKTAANKAGLIKKGIVVSGGVLMTMTLMGMSIMVAGKQQGKATNVATRGVSGGRWKTFKDGMILSLGAGLATVLWKPASDLYGYLTSKLWESNADGLPYVLSFAKRIQASFLRLQGSMEELPKHNADGFLGKHYFSEVIDAFNLLVLSIETFLAIFLYELEQANGKANLVVEDYKRYSHRLFKLCHYVADCLEQDLRGVEFRDETIQAVESLARGCYALLPNNAAEKRV